MPADSPDDLDAASLAVIYSSPLADPPWQGAVEFICDELDAVVMGLSFRVAGEGMPTVGVQAFRGSGRRLWSLFWSRYSDVGTFDYPRLKAGQINPLSEYAESEEALEILRRDLHAPFDVGESYALPIGPAGSPIAYLIWLQSAEKPLTRDQRSWCERAAPHLARAIGGYQRMRQAELASWLAGDALGHLSIGIAAIDRNDRILFTNGEGERIIAQSPDLGRHAGRLTAARPALAERLALSRKAPQAARIRGGRDEPISMLMTAVGRRDELGPGSRPERAIYFHDLSASVRVSERLISELFELTAVEARLSALLAEGLTLRDAARKLGVTENTARTYSKLIFSKLGISRQVDLVRLLLRSVAVLGPAE